VQTMLVENTEMSYRWLAGNSDNVSEKKHDALELWAQMSTEERAKHTLLARYGE
jgi:hypothetical protein